jgi:uncharacterized protein (DUF1015 family)
MGMENYTAYQQKVIKRFYEHKDDIALQRLAELVTDLYLAEGKKRATVWKNVAAALTKLKIPAERIAHLQASDDPKLVAAIVTELGGS